MAYETKEEILEKADTLVGKTFRQLLLPASHETNVKDKGGLGSIIERCYGIKKNNLPYPDFQEAGIELKVTPLKMGKDGKLRAKERLVCDIINYEEEGPVESFQESAFYKKCAQMLIFFYRHFAQRLDSVILNCWLMLLMELPLDDLQTIIHDWEIIHEKISTGHAHELSESDTDYLAACTKGADSRELRKQYAGGPPAKPRAYSLKSSYMTVLYYREVLKEPSGLVSLGKSNTAKKALETFVYDQVKPYVGKTEAELCAQFGINPEAKNKNGLVFLQIFGLSGESCTLDKIEEFRKANIRPTSIRIRKNGMPKEALPFPAFTASKIAKTPSWESSELYEYLSTTRFLFIVFRERNDGQYAFSQCKFWNMPSTVLDMETGGVKDVWEATREVIRSGNVLADDATPLMKRTMFPKERDNPYAHVRPHARDGKDVDTSFGKPFTKSCFWLNKVYLKTVLEQHE